MAAMTLMRLIHRANIGCALGAYLSLASGLSVAGPGSISGDIDTGLRDFVGANTTGTSQLFAHSKRTNPNAVGPNSNTCWSKPDNSEVSPVPVAVGILINVQRANENKDVVQYAPVVKVDVPAKPPADRGDGLVSESPKQAIFFEPGVYAQARVQFDSDKKQFIGFVQCHATNGGKGVAAGAAFDPFEVPSRGTPYEYVPTINASLQITGSLDSAAANYYALDSRFTDLETFFERGQPLDETLWYLSISSDGPSTTTSNVDVDFKINADARADGTLSVALSDAEIVEYVRNALELDSSTNTISLPEDFPLFSTTGLFNVPEADGLIQYGMAAAIGLQAFLLPGDYNEDDAVDAADYTVWRDGGSPDDTIAGYDQWKSNFGISGTGTNAAVPEPSALLLVAIGMCAFVVWRQQESNAQPPGMNC